MYKTCFISAPAGTDLRILTSSLERHGYKVSAPDDLSPGQPWLDALIESIRRADLIVGVFATRNAVGNVAFELGCAAANGKRVLVLASPSVEDMPFAVSSLLVVRCDPTAQEAIDFVLDNLPDSVPLVPSASIAPSNRIIPRTHLEAYKKKLATATKEFDLITVLRELLLESGVDVVTEARFGNRVADFAIWSDELGTYVGNPLIIEVKRQLRGLAGLAQALAQLTTYLQAANASWGLLLYDEGPESVLFESQLSQSSKVLAISIGDLLDRLQTVSFVDVIRDLRNRKVHGVGR